MYTDVATDGPRCSSVVILGFSRCLEKHRRESGEKSGYSFNTIEHLDILSNYRSVYRQVSPSTERQSETLGPCGYDRASDSLALWRI